MSFSLVHHTSNLPPFNVPSSIERMFEDMVLSQSLTVGRSPAPVADLSGLCIAAHAVEVVPADVGVALAVTLFRVVAAGADVIIPSNSSLLRCAAFLSELLEGRDLRPSLRMLLCPLPLSAARCCQYLRHRCRRCLHVVHIFGVNPLLVLCPRVCWGRLVVRCATGFAGARPARAEASASRGRVFIMVCLNPVCPDLRVPCVSGVVTRFATLVPRLECAVNRTGRPRNIGWKR